MNIVFLFFILSNQWSPMSFNLCSDPSIESAVRVSVSKFILIFKGQTFWVLNTERSTLSNTYSIANFFTNYGDIRTMIGSWVDSGFDNQSPNKGSVYLLKSKTVYKYGIVLTNENSFNVTFNKTYAFGQFWSGSDGFPNIEAITDLNTIRDTGDYKTVGPRDLLAINSDRFVLLWPEPSGNTYVTNKFMCARSDQPDELSIFDVSKRNPDYWGQNSTQDCNKWKGVKMSTIIDPKAIVYFPSGTELYVFGQKDFCKIKIGISEKNLKCNKQSIKKLLGCDVKSTTAMIGGEVEEDQPINDKGSTSDQPTDPSAPQGEKESDGNRSKGSNNLILYAGIAILVVIMIIIAVIILFLMFKRKRDQSKSQKYEPVVVQPIDPRYGQLDSNVNISMKIANPSYTDLDQTMANQQIEEAQQAQHSNSHRNKKNDLKEDKTERSGSDSDPPSRQQKSRKTKTKKWRSPRSPINE